MQLKTMEYVKVFLLGMMVAFLAVLVFRPQQSLTIAADAAGVGTAAKSGDILALTGPENSNLYLIDTANQYIAQYAVDTARFSLRAARYYKNDLYIKDLNKKGGIDIKEAKAAAEKSASSKGD